MKNTLTATFASAVLVVVAACENPAKDKAQATVSSAIVVPSGGSMATTGVAVFPITPENTKIEWTGSKVTGSHDGSFQKFSGSITVVDGKPETSKVTLDIDTASLMVSPEKLLGHLKSPDFFDVEKFPKATFVSTSVAPGGAKGATHTVAGNLTLHGVTKGISFPATLKVSGDTASADAEFVINRKDFGLNYPGKADDLIRDEVVIKLKAHPERTKS